MKRRLFLKYGLGGAALLSLGGVGLLLRPGRSAPLPEGGLKALTPGQWATLVYAAAVINPGSSTLPSSDQLDTPKKIDRLVATLDPDLQDEIRLILTLVENPLAGALFDAQPKPFSALSEAERLTAITNWQQSRLSVRRAAIKALVGLVHSVHWSHSDNWAHMGYPGPPPLGAAHAR